MSLPSAIIVLVLTVCFMPPSKAQTFDYLLDIMLNASACAPLFATQKFPISDRDCNKATCDYPNEVCIITEAQSESQPENRSKMSFQERLLNMKVTIVRRRIEHHKRMLGGGFSRNKRQAKSSNLKCEHMPRKCRSAVVKAIEKFEKTAGEGESASRTTSESPTPLAEIRQPPAPVAPTPQPTPVPTPGTPFPQPAMPSWPAPAPAPIPVPVPTPAAWPASMPSPGGGSYLRPPPIGYLRPPPSSYYPPQGSGYFRPPGIGK